MKWIFSVSETGSSIPNKTRLLFSKAFWKENQVTAHASNTRGQKEGAGSWELCYVWAAQMPLQIDSCFQVIYLQRFTKRVNTMGWCLGNCTFQKKSLKCETLAEVSGDVGDAAGTAGAAKCPPRSGSRDRILNSSPWRNSPCPGDILDSFEGLQVLWSPAKGLRELESSFPQYWGSI